MVASLGRRGPHQSRTAGHQLPKESPMVPDPKCPDCGHLATFHDGNLCDAVNDLRYCRCPTRAADIEGFAEFMVEAQELNGDRDLVAWRAWRREAPRSDQPYRRWLQREKVSR